MIGKPTAPGFFGLTHPTMNTEANAAPDVAADTATSEQIANTTPEVATPESSAEEQGQQTEKPEADDSDKSLKRLQRRVDRVTAARYQAEARAQQLEEQLARFQQQAQPEGEAQQVDPYELAKQIATAERITERSNAVYRDGVKAHGDAFMQSVAAVQDEAGPLFDKRGLATPLGEAILDADKPADLLAYIGKNPDIAESLQGLSAAQLGRRIASIEAQMVKPEPKASKAPLPLEPVKASGKVQKSPSEMTDAEFSAYRKAQIAKRR